MVADQSTVWLGLEYFIEGRIDNANICDVNAEMKFYEERVESHR